MADTDLDDDDVDEPDDEDEDEMPAATPRRSAADVLFGAPVTQPTGPAKQPGPATTRRSHADILFGDAVAASRAPAATPPATPPTPAERLFAPTGPDLSAEFEVLGDKGGVPVAEQRAEAAAVWEMANDLNLDSGDARKLSRLIVGARLDGETDKWQQEAAGWPTASRRALRERYGPEKAETVAADIAALIKSKPELAKRLKGGLAQHPYLTTLLGPLVQRGNT